MKNSNTQVLTVQEVANLLNCGNQKIYRLLQSGTIPGFKIGGSWRIWKHELEQFLNSQSNQSKTKMVSNYE